MTPKNGKPLWNPVIFGKNWGRMGRSGFAFAFSLLIPIGAKDKAECRRHKAEGIQQISG